MWSNAQAPLARFLRWLMTPRFPPLSEKGEGKNQCSTTLWKRKVLQGKSLTVPLWGGKWLSNLISVLPETPLGGMLSQRANASPALPSCLCLWQRDPWTFLTQALLSSGNRSICFKMALFWHLFKSCRMTSHTHAHTHNHRALFLVPASLENLVSTCTFERIWGQIQGKV